MAVPRAEHKGHLRHPFGERCFEDELRYLGDRYTHYYFEHVPFNTASLDPNHYLIVGRRGSGKSSLAHHFTFQKKYPNARCIDVSKPSTYQQVLQELAGKLPSSRDLAIPALRDVWEFVIWTLIFRRCKGLDPRIPPALILDEREGRPARLVVKILEYLLRRFGGANEGDLFRDFQEFFGSHTFHAAKDAVIEHAPTHPVFVAVDSLEHYALDEDQIMWTTAALVQCAAAMNRNYSDFNIHIKVFLTAEVFPHLVEEVIQNPLKSVRDPIHLHWRPKDLLRLVSWRYFHYRRENGERSHSEPAWSDFSAVAEKVWQPLFGMKIHNALGREEDSFAYLLRHTQLRPRQLVFLLNSIAKAHEDGTPTFDPKTIVSAVKDAELELANEVINSYSRIYPTPGKIVNALRRCPMVFQGNLLDSLAPKSAQFWEGDYSPDRFKQLIAELGIIGEVRRRDTAAGFVEADFEYFLKDRLSIDSDGWYAIHPMFYARLRIETQDDVIVFPFPDSDENREQRLLPGLRA